VSDDPPPPRGGVPAGVVTGTQLQEAQANASRKSSAQAKRDGDDAKIKADIAQCDKGGLQIWHENFDSYTAALPLSWLDSIRDQLELRLEELNAAEAIGPEAEQMDEAFRQTMGGGHSAGVSGRNGQVAA